MTNDFLAVAYDVAGGYLYGGGHISGIARIKFGVDRKWEWINDGLLGDDLWMNEVGAGGWGGALVRGEAGGRGARLQRGGGSWGVLGEGGLQRPYHLLSTPLTT